MRALTLALTFVTAGPLSAGVAPVLPRLPDEVVAKLRPAAKATPPAAEESPAAIAERIVAQSKAAGDRLEEKDSGVFTQKTQQGILDDIDKLLKPPPPMDGDGGPPPPPMGGTPPPMGGESGSKPPPMGGESGGMPPPMGGGKPMPGATGESPPSRGQARKEQREREAQAGKDPGDQGPPMPMPPGGKKPTPMPGGKDPGGPGDKTPGAGGEGPGKPASKPALPPDDAATKQVWGHLPDRLRQEMNQYYKEQFMPKYNDMLRQYYSRLAEGDKRPRK